MVMTMITSTRYQDNPALTHKLSEFINFKYEDDLTFRNFSILEKINDIEMLDFNLVDEYLPELADICKAVTLSDEEYIKYKYCPDLLAYDVYGTTQLDFVVLLANDMIDPKEFDLKTIKLPYKSALISFLEVVYNSNSGFISQNRADNDITLH